MCVVFHPACGVRHHWAKGQLQMLMVYPFHMKRFQHFTWTDVKSYSKVRRLGRLLWKSLSNFTQRSTGSLSPLWFVINWWSDKVISQLKSHLCSASSAVPFIVHHWNCAFLHWKYESNRIWPIQRPPEKPERTVSFITQRTKRQHSRCFRDTLLHYSAQPSDQKALVSSNVHVLGMLSPVHTRRGFDEYLQ